jgi:hypothetical protein
MLTCLFLLIFFIVFTFVAFSNERKHLSIIHRLRAHRSRESKSPR